jgi:VWFA-related protein
MRVQNRFEEFKFTAFIFILLFILFGFQNIGYSQNTKPDENRQNETQEDIIRVDTSLVTVPISVLDREGRFVTNLKKEDFQIFEDGVEQEVALFETTEQSVTVLLLLDVSGSMFNDLGGLTNATSNFLSQLRPNDKVMVATFNEWVDVLCGFKSVKDLRSDKKLRVKIDGRPPVTMVYDAVEFGLKKMKKIRGRKAIVLFSDGKGSGYNASAKSNIHDAEENEALVYTVQFNTFVIPLGYKLTKKDSERIKQENETATLYMSELATKTGGRYFQMDNIGDLEKTFRLVAEELRQQYSLGYYPKQIGKEGERRQIKVRVKIPNLAVRARDSYVVGNSKNVRK